MPSYYRPKELINGLDSPSDLNYAYESASNMRCLYSTCYNLGEGVTYRSADHKDATPPTFGCWFPLVANQNELNNNFTKITNTAGSYTRYLFFKSGSSGICLYETATLSSGFANGTLVPVLEWPDETVTTSNFSTAKLLLHDQDGPVIIVGILDSIDPMVKG